IDNARSYQAVRRAERKAELERQRLREVFAHAPGAIWIMSGPDHVIEFANPAALGLFPGRELIGKPVRATLDHVDERRIELLDRVFRTGERFTALKVPALLDWRGDGHRHERWF